MAAHAPGRTAGWGMGAALLAGALAMYSPLTGLALLVLLVLALPGIVEGGMVQEGKCVGMTIDLAGLGRVQLTRLLAQTTETEVYRTHHAGVVVKVFDLDCGKADEYSYGPYLEYCLELGNFGDIQQIEEIREYLPAYYGSHLDPERKLAYIAMECIEGQDLTSWCAEGAQGGYPDPWVMDFREGVYETFAIMRRFHRHGIILIDFKPDDILRLPDKRVKFVDLGAFYTPRHLRESHNYVYSTTPDHAELLIDASNVPTGRPLTEASDIFSAGVALFEMATGKTRLAIDGRTADDILKAPEIYLFRNSQIRDLWRANPHLKGVIPLLDDQLKERRIIFSEIWHLLKGYVAHRLADWDTLAEEQKDQIVLATGMTFIMEQLPTPLQWLAAPICQATTLRNLRLKSVSELMRLLADPIPAEVGEQLARHDFLQYLRDLDRPADFVPELNTWSVRFDPTPQRWAIGLPEVASRLGDAARFAFLKSHGTDDQGHRYYHLVVDLEADRLDNEPLSPWHLRNDRFAWLGCAPG